MISLPHTRTAALAAVLLTLSATAAAHVAPDSCGLSDSTKPFIYLVNDHDGEGVNIRSRSNTQSTILAVCDNQSEATMLGKNGAWYHVRLVVRPYSADERRVITGFVHQSQVSLHQAYVVHGADGSANVRLAADTRAEVLDRLPNGTVVTEYPAKRQGDWHYVSFDGGGSPMSGFVHKSQLRPKRGGKA